MECPVCTHPMVALELDMVEIDHCVKCGGVWLDAGELELLLDGAENRDQVLAQLVPDPSVAEAPRKCPICRKRMQKMRAGADGAVVVDRCTKNGDGVWLDRGELRRVVAMGRFPEENRVEKLLIDVFGDRS